MQLSNRARAGAALAVCVAIGAAGGIAGSLAAPAKKSASTKARAGHGFRDGRPGFGHGGPGMRAVHEEEVVLNKAGTAFITATEDNGKVKAVSGNDITITEGTATVTYKDVTVTIPSGATVYRNGKAAKVSDIAVGDNVHVRSSSDGTDVDAFDKTFAPGPGRGGPGGPDGHHGPPPGMMPGA